MESLDGMRIGDLEIWPKEHLLEVLGHEVALTVREFDILLKLAEHPGWTYSISQLAADDDDNEYSPESVTVLVSRLRRKLAAAGAPDVIETVRGIGYRLAGQFAPHDHASPTEDEADRELRDALWRLQEAVIDVERLGDTQHEREVSELLERARRAVDGTETT